MNAIKLKLIIAILSSQIIQAVPVTWIQNAHKEVENLSLCAKQMHKHYNPRYILELCQQALETCQGPLTNQALTRLFEELSEEIQAEGGSADPERKEIFDAIAKRVADMQDLRRPPNHLSTNIEKSASFREVLKAKIQENPQNLAFQQIAKEALALLQNIKTLEQDREIVIFMMSLNTATRIALLIDNWGNQDNSVAKLKSLLKEKSEFRRIKEPIDFAIPQKLQTFIDRAQALLDQEMIRGLEAQEIISGLKKLLSEIKPGITIMEKIAKEENDFLKKMEEYKATINESKHALEIMRIVEGLPIKSDLVELGLISYGIQTYIAGFEMSYDFRKLRNPIDVAKNVIRNAFTSKNAAKDLEVTQCLKVLKMEAELPRLQELGADQEVIDVCAAILRDAKDKIQEHEDVENRAFQIGAQETISRNLEQITKTKLDTAEYVKCMELNVYDDDDLKQDISKINSILKELTQKSNENPLLAFLDTENQDHLNTIRQSELMKPISELANNYIETVEEVWQNHLTVLESVGRGFNLMCQERNKASNYKPPKTKMPILHFQLKQSTKLPLYNLECLGLTCFYKES